MLSEEGCRGRRKRLWEALPRQVEWVLVADPRHVNYLSGFWVNPVSLSFGERGLLYLERDGDSALLCDNFTLKSAIGRAFVDRQVVEPWYDHRHGVPNRDHVLFRALERQATRACPLLPDLGPSGVGKAPPCSRGRVRVPPP